MGRVVGDAIPCTGAPQREQNRESDGISEPHFAQNIAPILLRSSLGGNQNKRLDASLSIGMYTYCLAADT